MGKNLAITDASSMQAWDEGADAYARPTRLCNPSAFAATSDELDAFTQLPQGCTLPVDILVGDAGNRVKSKEWYAHVRTGRLPAGSLLGIGQHRYLTTPAFFFLKTAARLSLVQAVLLGMELCGFYSTLMSVPYWEHCDRIRGEQGGVLLSQPWPPESWDMSYEHQKDLMDSGFVTRPPLVDSAGLAKYVQSALSDKSNSVARTALPFIADNSHSPMESRLYARYCLPRRYGGLNLTPVVLNQVFELSPEIAQAIGITHYSVDLFWPQGAIAIEYQGRHAHSGLSAEQKDRLKRNILQSEGVRIISIDRAQYSNEDMLDYYGMEIAKSMGIAERKLWPAPREQSKRFALSEELRSWDFDLYRPAPRKG